MEMTPLVLGEAQVRSLESSLWEALFDHLAHHPPRASRQGLPSISVTEAKDILKVALPHYRGSVAPLAASVDRGESVPRQVGQLLHHWVHASIRYFRRTGARGLREGLSLERDARVQRLWRTVFDGVLLGHVQGSNLLDDPAGRETCDLAVESLKLWVADIVRRLNSVDPATFSPSVFFLDTEGDLEGVIGTGRRRVHVRGRPDALLFDPSSRQLSLCEYKFGAQGEIELQIAQLLLYVRLLEQAKGVSVSAGELQVFRARPDAGPTLEDDDGVPVVVAGDSEFPHQVDRGFGGYVGNTAAVRRLKIQCTLALRGEAPVRMPVNLMFCGPAGLGKTELARRVARVLGLPFVDIPGGLVANVDALMAVVDRSLSAAGIEVPVRGLDAGLPVKRYPPFVLFVDEVHDLKKRADAFLNVFEPSDRRGVGATAVGDFTMATILGATTDRGRLPAAFLSRFRMIELEPYTENEIAQILAPLFLHLAVGDDVLTTLARIGRLTPRLALERAREMLDRHRFSPSMYPLTHEGLQRVCNEQWGVDAQGLTGNDRRYLRALSGGPRGLTALGALLPVGRDELERIIEPFLLQVEAIRITPAGRALTELGRMLAPRD
ncbi:MAG: Holliday junction DNA helicase RuvB C-terminal domain-containing protein [Vicinamibacterales bacterium]|nr:Holliday junction DNA helicase RuvB C-terminal domain-containing protein [Vicinamibacterales bacterium]